MRSKRWLSVLSLWALMLGIGVAQPPLLVLTNGDVNGDNLVDDADLLAVLFRMGDACPRGCPEDLNGDLTVDDADLLTVLFHMGAQGAPAFAGQVSTPQGAFRVSLRLQLGGWAGASQSVKVQLKPVGTEDDASVPIYEWTFSVSGAETEVELDNLPAGVYTVRAFPVAPGRWLRAEGKLITEVPWIFAVPTGASKVTVYWDGVPGATGYRVRWGVHSGVYPNASGVLPAGVRRYTVEGLVSEQEYYFVVEAEYNGVFGASSEEDSAVPHAGAIPWDTNDPDQIIAAVEAQAPPGMRAGVYDDVWVVGPDGSIYTRVGGIFPADGELSLDQNAVFGADGITYPLPSDAWTETSGMQETLPPDAGPYRRVRSPNGFKGVKGKVYLPMESQISLQTRMTNLKKPERLPDGTKRLTWQPNQTVRDAANAYVGSHSPKGEVDAGVQYNPMRQWWMPFITSKPDPTKRQDPLLFPDAGNREADPDENRFLPGQWIEITYHVGNDAVYCNIKGRNMYYENKTLFLRSFKPHRRNESIQVKRVHSISHVIGWRDEQSQEPRRWYPTGSFIRGMAWDLGQYWDGNRWQQWTRASQNGSYPQRGSIINWNEQATFWRENEISIQLPR